MRNLLLCVLISLTLSACSSLSANKPKEQIIMHCPSPQLPEKPKLEIEKLNAKASEGEVLRAYGVSLEQTINYSNTLENIINNYKNLEYVPIK